MARIYILELLTSRDWLESLIPDFVLAFALFTSLIYSVLGRRMGHQRPAIAASAALGAALSGGLVAWERYNDLSIMDLGPLAAGFGLIILAGVMYQAIRGIGGNWAGAGIAFGACLLVGWALGIDWPVDAAIVQTVTSVTLTVGVIAFLLHRKGQFGSFQAAAPEATDLRHDMSDLDEDRRVSKGIRRRLHHVREEAATLWQRPSQAGDVMLQLRRILPAEGWLTQRMTRLRARAILVQKGHVARIQELRGQLSGIPSSAKVKISRELMARYRELKLDERIERLDRLVASHEAAVRDLTQQAQQHLAANEFQKLNEDLATAENIQKRCSRLFKLIDQTEKRLLVLAKDVAQKSNGVSHA